MPYVETNMKDRGSIVTAGKSSFVSKSY